MQKYFDEWVKRGMRLGCYDYVVMVVEGYIVIGGSGLVGLVSIILG